MTRRDYVQRVIRLYLDAPDTPDKPRKSDWTVAASFHDDRVPIELIEHAIALATLRRHLRPPDADPLEPIRSLAYIRPLISHLRQTAVDDGYRAYVASRYAQLLRGRRRRANGEMSDGDRKTAVPDDR